MASSDKNVILVAAIDFGTTFSGYGFSFKNAPDDILMSKNWGAEIGFQSYKTPTSLLVDAEGKFKAFGYAAESEYTTAVSESSDDQEVVEEEQDSDETCVSDIHLFKQFKMELHGKEKLDKNVKLTATDGEYKMAALNVFAMSLEYLKNHLIEAVNQTLKTPITARNVMWVLTVPAIWSEVAKTFMKEAAHTAKLVESVAAANLIIALEPEAASLWCRTKDIKQFVSGEDGKISKQKQGAGDKYMVIDAGGGTMDITVHEIQSEEKVKELFRATGGPWGGIYVDKKLTELYDDIFGKEIMEKFRREYPNLWMTVLLDWEQKKRGTNPAEKKPVNLGINAQFASFYQEETGEKIKAKIQKQAASCRVKFNNGMLSIHGEKVAEMFNSVLSPTVEHLKALLSRPVIKDLNCIFIVGGFGESKYLQEKIKSEFTTKNRAVLIPLDASLCVIKGAVLFGHNPTSITSRIARCTYCFKTTTAYDPKKHEVDKAPKCENNPKRIYYLRPLVKMNSEIPQDGEKSITTRALDATQKSIKFTIFTANKEEVFDPRDKEVQEIGDLVIPITPTKDPNGREVDLKMEFGGTSLQVTATHKATGKKESVELSLPES